MLVGKKLILAEKIALSVVYLFLTIVYVLAVFQSGFAKMGLTDIYIPDTTLTVTFVIFIVATLVQALYYHFKKDKRFAGFYIAEGIFITIKTILIILAIYMLDNYALQSAYYNYGDKTGFYSNYGYMIIVALFLTFSMLSAIIEIVTLVTIKIANKINN